jgi:hypothetical protein
MGAAQLVGANLQPAARIRERGRIERSEGKTPIFLFDGSADHRLALRHLAPGHDFRSVRPGYGRYYITEIPGIDRRRAIWGNIATGGKRIGTSPQERL